MARTGRFDRVVWIVAIGAAGCGSPDTDVADTSDGACGEPSLHDVTVEGSVVDGDTAAGVAGATVTLRDGQWSPPETLGTATTAADGTFSLAAAGVTDLPGCWGIVLDYQLEVTDGVREASRGINGPLEAAIREGGVASVEVPIEL